jgi:hypothetical protein
LLVIVLLGDIKLSIGGLFVWKNDVGFGWETLIIVKLSIGIWVFGWMVDG